MGGRDIGRWLITTGVSAAICVGMTGYMVRRAHADGISAMNPMTYSGTLQNAGAPATGSYSFLLTVWSDPASTTSADLQCTTIASGVTVTNGQFRVPLDNSCTTPVHNIPDLWIDVSINGTELGRSKMGAVPYAVEAARAASLSPAAAAALVPSGTIVAYGGTTAPSGWLFCDGSAVSRTGDAALFSAIGTVYGGGDGTTTFNLPDLRGRAAIGVGSGPGLTPRSAGQAFGAESHTQSVAEMPSHNHTIVIYQAGSGSNMGVWNYNWDAQPLLVGGPSALQPLLGAGLQNFMGDLPTGGGTPFPTIPPVLAVNYIIKL